MQYCCLLCKGAELISASFLIYQLAYKKSCERLYLEEEEN